MYPVLLTYLDSPTHPNACTLYALHTSTRYVPCMDFHIKLNLGILGGSIVTKVSKSISIAHANFSATNKPSLWPNSPGPLYLT